MKFITALSTIAALASSAQASPWVTAELPAAMPLSDTHASIFSPGLMPSIAGFVGLGRHAAVGLRLRAGALGDGAAPMGGLRDPGRGGLTSALFGMRFTASDVWIEADAGGGVTGSDAVPTFEVGLGTDLLSLGAFDFGPSVRYVRVIGGSTPMDPGSAALVLVGVEVRLGGRHPVRIAPEPAIVETIDRDEEIIADRDAACPSRAAGAALIDVGCATAPGDRDGDGITDDVDKCPDEAEVVNGVEDRDGCPDEGGMFEVADDRIVLDERVLFDLNRARIKHAGRPVIAAIAKAWHEHPDWAHLVIEGHCDVRGPDSFNQWLSSERANRVREALIREGVPPDRVEAIGYGSSHPRDTGADEAAHQRNRRVEFEIQRGTRPQ